MLRRGVNGYSVFICVHLWFYTGNTNNDLNAIPFGFASFGCLSRPSATDIAINSQEALSLSNRYSFGTTTMPLEVT